MVKILISLFITLSLNNNAFAVTKDYKKAFMDSRLSKRLNMSKFGLSMYHRDKGSGEWKKVLSHNSNNQMIPASITKVLTGVGLLELHGNNAKVETKVYVAEKPKKGVIQGDLYIVGGGDPTLVSEKLWLLINEIKKWGIRRIDGNLIFDDTVFDQNQLSGGRTKWNQRAYNAALSGLALNWNSVRVRFLDGESLNVVTDPYNPYFELRPKKMFRKSSQVEIRKSKDKEVLSVFFGKDALIKEKSIYRRVFDPKKSFERQFVQFLKNADISFTGKSIWGKAPEGLFELGKIQSASMSRMVELMMKHSNNFIADMLTKFSYHTKTSQSGNYEGGLKTLQESFQKIYKFPNGVDYPSASGLSRNNRVTPEDFTQFLLELQDWSFYPELMSALPLSCVDGTLKERLCKVPGKVRAKTGLLAGVSTLAGFLRKNGEDYVFTFMYNGSNGEQFDARDSFDNFLEKL